MVAKNRMALSSAVLDGKVSDSMTLGGKRESGNRRSEINRRVVARNSGRCSTEQQVISRYFRFLSDIPVKVNEAILNRSSKVDMYKNVISALENMGSYDYAKLCDDLQVAEWRASWMAEKASRESRGF